MTRLLAAVIGALAALPAARAQEGYPLDGTWRGTIGPAGGAQDTVVIVMKWDGKSINGIVNPGRRATSFTAAELEPSDWSVRFEARVSGDDGAQIPVVIEGTLRDLGSYHRSIVGTWTAGGAAQPVTLRRE